jgi:type IV pilus assembly protein PilQ
VKGGKELVLDTPEVQKIRLGKSGDKLRVVLDLTSSEKPAYTINRQDTTLSLTVVAKAPSAEPEAAPVVAEAAPPEAEPVPPPSAEAPAAEPVREAAVVITGVGFKQLKDRNQSRVMIRANEAGFAYTTRDEPGSIVVTIPNSRLEKPILRREFDTREFRTAITSIAPQGQNGAMEFVIGLEQQVAYSVNQEGADLYVDVEVPAEILRKQTADQVRTGAPAEETTAPAEEAEVMLSAEQVRPTRDVEAPKARDYRYVKESFMSDSGAGEAGGALSDMAAILAGEYRGRSFTGRKISLDFKDAEIRSIFRLLADISKFNLIISDDVGGRVTVRLNNVPWDQAFAIILQTKGLWFEKYGNIVRIAPAEKLRQERELAAATARASQAAKPLDVLFKPVSYATANDLVRQVRSVLTDRGTVDVDTRTNTLIIKDIRESLEKAKKMVEILDTQTPQVSIESRIVEASTNFTRSFGIVWGGQANFSSATGNPTGAFFPNSIGAQGLGAGAGATTFSGLPVALNYPSPLGQNAGIGLRLGSINNVVDLDVALGLMESQGNAKLISSPKITVLDNEAATISAGTRIPFVTTTSNSGSSVRFENAVTSLNVTPHITNDGSISMQIAATRNEPNFSQLVQGNPVVDQRQASTKVLVKSGNTTVLGGIYSIRTGSVKDSLPGVSKIPIIGWLFRNYSKELRRTELLIFVTPRIVGDEREAVRDIRG